MELILAAPRLGLALRTADEIEFREAVHDLLDENNDLLRTIYSFTDAASSSNDFKYDRKIEKIRQKLDEQECKLVCLDFVPPCDAIGDTAPRHRRGAVDPTQLRRYNAMTNWLANHLVDWNSFSCRSSQRQVMCSTIVRWLFWMTVLDWGYDLTSFCFFLCDGGVEREEAMSSLEVLLDDAKKTLKEAYLIIRREPHPNLKHRDPEFRLRPRGVRAGRGRYGGRLDNDHEPSSSPIEVITSSAGPCDHESTGLLLYITTKIEIRFAANGPPLSATLDTGASFSSIDRKLLLEHFPGVRIKRLPKPFDGSGVGGSMKYSHYAIVDIFISAQIDGKDVLAKLKHSIEVADDFRPGMLFGEDIIKHHGMIIDAVRNEIIITGCRDAKAGFTTPVSQIVQRRSRGKQKSKTLGGPRHVTTSDLAGQGRRRTTEGQPDFQDYDMKTTTLATRIKEMRADLDRIEGENEHRARCARLGRLA